MSTSDASIIKPIQWCAIEPPNLPAAIADWLMELGSMTRRFELHCQQVHVEPQRECFISRDELGEEAEHLPI
ncbi:chorismate pyruvate lyase, partial [Yersinia enterocolitica subsp. enterocolitica WA-314]